MPDSSSRSGSRAEPGRGGAGLPRRRLLLALVAGSVGAPAARAEPKVDNEMSRYWRGRVATWAAEPRPPAHGIVLLGDSMTERFPTQTLQGARSALPLINRGIGGDKVGGWRYLGLLDRLDDTVLALRPRQVVLMIGVNDVVFAGTPTAALHEGAGELLQRLGATVPQVLVQSVLPVRGRHRHHNGAIEALNREWARLANRHGMVWLDLAPAFRDERGDLAAGWASDDIHLNAAGYARWAGLLAPRLAR